MSIPDRILDFYDFVCSQGGFQNLGIAFEHFLGVIAVPKLPGLRPRAAAAASGDTRVGNVR